METKCDKTRIQKVCKTLGYSSCFVIDSIENASGLAFIWADHVNLKIKWNSGRIICGEFIDPNSISD